MRKVSVTCQLEKLCKNDHLVHVRRDRRKNFVLVTVVERKAYLAPGDTA